MKTKNFWWMATAMALSLPFGIESTWAGPLHEAAKKGDLKAVKQLLKNGADPNAYEDPKMDDSDDRVGYYRLQRTPLHFASQNGHLEVVKLLVSKGADVKAVQRLKFSKNYNPPDKKFPPQQRLLAFHFACEGAHLEVVRYFISEHKIDPKTAADMRLIHTKPYQPRHLDYKLNGIQLAILSHQLAILADYHAAQKGATKSPKKLYAFVRFMAGQGVPLPRTTPYLRYGTYKLSLPILAAGTGSLELVKYLVEEQHQPLNAAEEGDTFTLRAIHFAAGAGAVDVMQYLVENGESVTQVYNSRPTYLYPLHFASWVKDAERRHKAIEFILDNIEEVSLMDISILKEVMSGWEQKNDKTYLLMDSRLQRWQAHAKRVLDKNPK